jgi:hypothetical protein
MNILSRPVLHAMLRATLAIMAVGSVAAPALAEPEPRGPRQHSDQNEARRAMLSGNVMPFSLLKRRVEKQIGGDADYLGSEFIPDRNSYRLKYMRDRNVLWVDVDGRTGDITGWAR